jgi:hypothetical protein
MGMEIKRANKHKEKIKNSSGALVNSDLSGVNLPSADFISCVITL